MTASTRPILIVDDEPDLVRLIEINLKREGFSTVAAGTGADALAAARAQTPDLVILDLMLPDLSGTEVCRRLRADEATRGVPIIMLTARGEEIDRVVGFEVGADDYVVKANLSIRELVLRIRAVLRRGREEAPAPAPSANEPDLGPLVIDREGHRVFVAGTEVPLTATEFRLLTVLAGNRGRVFGRGRLLQDVWDMPPDLNTRTVDTHVKRLREKLGAAASCIETVRGVGYRFASDPEP